jgi:hypothetical protein
MMMAAIAYNLKKMMKFKASKPMAAMARLPKEADHFINSLFFRIIFSIQLFINRKSKISIGW